MIEVETTTLGELVAAHGVPYYLKSDIEGADEFVIEQLETLPETPRYVSVEASGDPLAMLVRCGYGRFQIVNQGYLGFFRARTRRVKASLPSSCRRPSRSFGRELPDGWRSATSSASRCARAEREAGSPIEPRAQESAS